MKCFLNINMSNTFTAVILTILVSYVSVEAEQVLNSIPTILMRILHKYDNFNKPNNTGFNEASNANSLRKSARHSEIEDTIRAKVIELTPLLDDNKYSRRNEINYEESSHDISNPAQLKYKEMRKEIKKLLEKELITNETKRVVIEALDLIENELYVNDCYWKKIDVKRRRNSKGSEPYLVIPKNMRDKESIMKHIKEKWDKIVNQFSMPKIDKSYNDTVRKVAFVFLTRLRQFVFDTHDDYTMLQDRYEMKCVTGAKFPVFRPDDNETILKTEKVDCDDIMICSEELLDFLTDFYDQLNKSYTDVIKNYIVMYLKEIDANDDQKKSFIEVLDSIKDQLCTKLKGIFKIELEKLNEVFSVPTYRIPSLKHLIDRTIHNAKETIYAAVSIELKKFKPILRLTVKQDINIATAIEMDNLRKEFKDKMCSVFRLCNGDVASRRHNKKYPYIDPNSIKIRFKFGLGDNPMNVLRPYLKKIIPNKSYRNFKANKRDGPEIEDSDEFKERKTNLPFDIDEYKAINVTRTTYADYVEKGTTTTKTINVTRTTYADYVEKGTTTTKMINNTVKNDTNVTTTESSISFQL